MFSFVLTNSRPGVSCMHSGTFSSEFIVHFVPSFAEVQPQLFGEGFIIDAEL